MHTTAIDSFRAMLSQTGLIVAPGCHDALGARIAESIGFKAVYMSGNATTASRIGRPDVGLLGMSEMIANARGITSSINIPVICDADTGYGGIDNVVRTVQEYESAGIAAIHIEDQKIPKKCGAMPGIEVVTIDEAVARVKAAVKAKRNPNFTVIARTDARAAVSFEEALRRAHAFAESGADMVIVEDLRSRDEVEKVPKEVTNVPLMFDVVEAWPWTNIPLQEIEQMGYKMVIYCLSATMAYAKILSNLFSEIKKVGHTKDFTHNLMDLHEYEKVLGLPKMIREKSTI
ncbi:isocitrate lyase/PEP mutase family protein [bacterium]|nr:isocitrate lyase/PEP mutase family protein [bacterium]